MHYKVLLKCDECRTNIRDQNSSCKIKLCHSQYRTDLNNIRNFHVRISQFLSIDGESFNFKLKVTIVYTI